MVSTGPYDSHSRALGFCMFCFKVFSNSWVQNPLVGTLVKNLKKWKIAISWRPSLLIGISFLKTYLSSLELSFSATKWLSNLSNTTFLGLRLTSTKSGFSDFKVSPLPAPRPYILQRQNLTYRSHNPKYMSKWGAVGAERILWWWVMGSTIVTVEPWGFVCFVSRFSFLFLSTSLVILKIFSSLSTDFLLKTCP